MISYGSAPKQRTGKERKPRAEAMLYGYFRDMLFDETPGHGIIAFCKHAGISMPGDADGWWPTFLAHYLNRSDANGRVDEARFAHDLASFPPIANRVAELQCDAA